jgi:hypothetical protein
MASNQGVLHFGPLAKERCSIVARYSIRSARERSAGAEGKQIIEGFGVVALVMDGLH